MGIQVPGGEVIDNIILAQAARHAIVHNGARVDFKCLKQLAGCLAEKRQRERRDRRGAGLCARRSRDCGCQYGFVYDLGRGAA